MSDQQPGSAVALSPSVRFRQELDAFTPDLHQALPANVSVDKFKRVLLTAISQTPALFNADRRSLFNSASKCATDGLLPDGREAALVVYNTKVKRRGEDGIDREFDVPTVQYLPMVAGIRKRMRNSGDVLSAVAEVVYRNDRFERRLGDDAMILHEPPPLGEERGVAVGAYAIIKLRNGEVLRDVMSTADIEVSRNQGRSKNSLMWTKFWGEGAKKTVLRRCAKSAPQSAEVEALLDREDDAATLSHHDLAALPAPEREPQREDFVDAETGEVVEELTAAEMEAAHERGAQSSVLARERQVYTATRQVYAGPTERRVAPAAFQGRDQRETPFQYTRASPAAERPGAGGMPALDHEPRQGDHTQSASAPTASERPQAGASFGEPEPARAASPQPRAGAEPGHIATLPDREPGNAADAGGRTAGSIPATGAREDQGSPPEPASAPAPTAAGTPAPQGKRAATPEQREATKRWKEIAAEIDKSTAIGGVLGLDGLEGSHPWVALEEALRLAEPPEVAAGAMQQLRDRIAKKRAELGGTKEGGY